MLVKLVWLHRVPQFFFANSFFLQAFGCHQCMKLQNSIKVQQPLKFFVAQDEKCHLRGAPLVIVFV